MASQLSKRIGKNIKRARMDRGLTQEALARKAGLSLGYLARIEIGGHDLPISTLAGLAKVLRVTIGKLVD